MNKLRDWYLGHYTELTASLRLIERRHFSLGSTRAQALCVREAAERGGALMDYRVAYHAGVDCGDSRAPARPLGGRLAKTLVRYDAAVFELRRIYREAERRILLDYERDKRLRRTAKALARFSGGAQSSAFQRSLYLQELAVPAEETGQEPKAQAAKEKRTISLLARAAAVETGAGRPPGGSALRARALEIGLKEARKAAAETAQIVARPDARTAEVDAAAKRLRRAAERIREALAHWPEPPHRVPKVPVSITARPDLENGSLVVAVREPVRGKDAASPGVKVLFRGRDGEKRSVVTGADGSAGIRLEELARPGRGLRLRLKPLAPKAGSIMVSLSRKDIREAAAKMRAAASAGRGTKPERVALAERAAELDPEDPDSYRVLAEAYETSGRTGQAIDAQFRRLELAGGEAAESIRFSIADLFRGLPAVRPVPLAAHKAAGRAARAVEKKRWDAAAKAMAKARREAPWWPEVYWIKARILELTAGSAKAPKPATLAAAREQYRLFLKAAPPGDDRREEARSRRRALAGLQRKLELPDIRVLPPIAPDAQTAGPAGRRNLYLGVPNVYFDLAGGSFSSGFRELRFLRCLLFSTRLRAGAGFTVFSRYKTPFEIRVSGRPPEKATITTLGSFETAFAPLNIRVWKNTVLSPQLYYSRSLLASATSASVGSYDAGLGARVTDYGVRMPIGAFVGLRLGRMHAVAPGGAIDVLGPAFQGFDETRAYAAFELFLGAMFGLPKRAGAR
ncbi:MAG: hypothetical protein ABII00_01745 [Elusimicrobiota bacterium]